MGHSGPEAKLKPCSGTDYQSIGKETSVSFTSVTCTDNHQNSASKCVPKRCNLYGTDQDFDPGLGYLAHGQYYDAG